MTSDPRDYATHPLPAERDEPTTAAGRDWRRDMHAARVGGMAFPSDPDTLDAIRAIEREAATPSVEALNMLRRIVAARHDAWLDDEIEGASHFLARLTTEGEKP